VIFTGYDRTQAKWYAEHDGARTYFWTRREALDEAQRMLARVAHL
jgi:hypothetical protein